MKGKQKEETTVWVMGKAENICDFEVEVDEVTTGGRGNEMKISFSRPHTMGSTAKRRMKADFPIKRNNWTVTLLTGSRCEIRGTFFGRRRKYDGKGI